MSEPLFAVGDEVTTTCVVKLRRTTIRDGTERPVECLPGTKWVVVAAVPDRGAEGFVYDLEEPICRYRASLPGRYLRSL